MSEIKCPKCGAIFEIDESCYDNILHQIKTEEFQKELNERLTQEKHSHEEQLKNLQKENELQKEKLISEHKRTLEQLRHETAEDKTHSVKELESKIQQLQFEIQNNEQSKALAIASAIQKQTEDIALKNEEIRRLEGNLHNAEERIKSSEKQHTTELELLKTRADSDKKEAVHQAKEHCRDEQEKELQTLKEKYEAQLKVQGDELERLKNFRSHQSTKRIGENLEQFCETEFNKLRATAFPKAFFEKDNDVGSGSKCDFIFREQTEDGIEIVSIAFEMKNETDAAVTKHKNEDFFKKLDKDRNEKKCKYAVLVSCLEQNNEFYNTGIADVSHKFPNMYVVRPQFFIAVISLLRNAALDAVHEKRQLKEYKNSNYDITTFESKLSDVKTKFENSFHHAKKKFNEAIAEIDKTIEHLKKIKDALQSSEKHLGSANTKLQDVTVRKLTYGNPTMQRMFAKLKENNKSVNPIELPFD